MRKVLLLKSKKDDDPYIKALEQHGYEGTCVPALSFQYINLDVLSRHLQQPEEYSGVILTSQNAVEACKRAQNASEEIFVSLWIAKRNYTVGRATYQKAKALLGLECSGDETGNVVELVTKINSDLKPETTAKFLYPKTTLKTIDLSDQLTQHGFRVDEVEVYNTLPDTEFQTNIAEYSIRQGSPDFVVFFSPSGVDYCLPTILSLFKDHTLLLSKFVAVGPSTSSQLTKKGIESHHVLDRPNAESLIACLTDAKS